MIAMRKILIGKNIKWLMIEQWWLDNSNSTVTSTVDTITTTAVTTAVIFTANNNDNKT